MAEELSKSDKNPVELDQLLARRIINDVGGTGQPPIYGYDYFTAGIDPYLQVIEDEYFQFFIAQGGSSFKLVLGNYGGGKTHFLYSVQGKAWKYNYITSYIQLKADSAPFHKLELVYKEIVGNLMYAQEPKTLFQGYDRGIEAIFKSWYYQQRENIEKAVKEGEVEEAVFQYIRSLGPFESKSFENAIKTAFLALFKNEDDDFNIIIQWLRGENPPKTELKRFRIAEKIDKTNAFKMLRSVIQWINIMGYKGVVVLLDEAERKVSLSSKDKETQLLNLREIIDSCSSGNIQHTLILYAVPDDNFLQGKTGIYEALNDRVRKVFEGTLNPSGVRIELSNLEKISDPVATLIEIGNKLAEIYQIGYDIHLPKDMVHQKISEIAEKAYEDRFGDIGYKRLFVQNVIQSFHEIKSQII